MIGRRVEGSYGGRRLQGGEGECCDGLGSWKRRHGLSWSPMPSYNGGVV